MPMAARVTDLTSHGVPMNPGIGSVDVLIGYMPAWRALPASVGGAVESVSNSVNKFMQKPVLTPPSATSDIANIVSGLVQAAGKAAAEMNPAALGAAAGASATLIATNVGLTTAWSAASVVPGGQPAANTAYTEGIKAAMAAASSAVFAAIGGMADTHICPIPCPIPPHGPGMVTKGSENVMIDNLPACRQGDKIMEACGGSDPIAMGCPTVMIGDSGGSGGGGGSSPPPPPPPASTSPAQQQVAQAASQPAASPAAPPPEQTGPLAPAEQEQQPRPPTWLGVRLFDFDGTPIAGENVSVTLDDGQAVSGDTDEEGYIRFDGLQPASGEANFPGISNKADLEPPQREESQQPEPESPRTTAARPSNGYLAEEDVWDDDPEGDQDAAGDGSAGAGQDDDAIELPW